MYIIIFLILRSRLISVNILVIGAAHALEGRVAAIVLRWINCDTLQPGFMVFEIKSFDELLNVFFWELRHINLEERIFQFDGWMD